MRDHGAEFDYVLLSRPTVAEGLIDDVRRFSSAKVVYYGHDLHQADAPPGGRWATIASCAPQR